MRHRKNRSKKSVPDIVLQFEQMLKADNIGHLDHLELEAIIEYYEQEQLFPQAKYAINLAIKRYPYQAGFLLSKISILLAKGETEEAKKLINKAEILAPNEWEIVFRRAELAAMNGAFEVALELLDDLIDNYKEADFGMLYLLKGMVYQELANFHKMYDALKLSLEADPTNEHALHLFWLSVEICQQHEESIEFHNWLIDQEPYSALAWSNLGHAYTCMQEWTKAAEAFEYAFIIDKEFEFAYRDCAIALIHLKQYRKALECLEEGMQYFDPDIEVLEQLGTCHIELGNFEEARIFLFDGLTIDANSGRLHFLLGRLHYRGGNHSKALLFLKRATQLEENQPEYLFESARIYLALADYDNADFCFAEACTFAPENLNLHLEYATFKGRIFGEQKALEFLKSVKDNFPDNAINYCAIGLMLHFENRKKGLVSLAQALNKDFSQHQTLLQYFPTLRKDAEVNAIIDSYRPV